MYSQSWNIEYENTKRDVQEGSNLMAEIELIKGVR